MQTITEYCAAVRLRVAQGKSLDVAIDELRLRGLPPEVVLAVTENVFLSASYEVFRCRTMGEATARKVAASRGLRLMAAAYQHPFRWSFSVKASYFIVSRTGVLAPLNGLPEGRPGLLVLCRAVPIDVRRLPPLAAPPMTPVLLRVVASKWPVG